MDELVKGFLLIVDAIVDAFLPEEKGRSPHPSVSTADSTYHTYQRPDRTALKSRRDTCN